MSALRTVVWFEFVRTLTKRSFWVRTLSIPVLIAAVITLSIFSSKVAQDQQGEQLKEAHFSIAILDDSKLISPAVLAAVHARSVASRSDGIEMARSGKIDAFFFYPAHPSKEPVEIYAKDDGLTGNNKYEGVATQLLQASLVQKVGSGELAQLLQTGAGTQLVTYKNGEQTKGFGRAVAPGLFLVLFYAVIVLLGNQMLTSTTEEKENRVIEMILTSVSARTVIVGKIIALVALGVIQIAAILVPVLVAYFGFRSQLHIQQIDLSQISFAPWPIVVGAALFTGGFLLFTALLVAIGAAVPTAKEASAFFGFTMILVFVPFYALGVIISSPHQVMVQVMSFFPLTAPITLMLRNAAGNLSVPETVVGLAILFVTGAVLMALAIRIFRFGSLEYARKLGLREILTRRS
ncbi:MAG TPA: ABC transporter permease [Candidatus Saccharimonadia bacterium]|nr:ABC transporter permease [Candidatus Saccharimonadia bacterium]